jgi:CrcB protein
MDFWRETIGSLAVVALGGAIGAMLRYGVKIALPVTLAWPWATLIVNALGAAAIAAAYTYAAKAALPPWFMLFLMTGVLGGFTTFSAFTLDVMQAMEKGAVLAAMAIVVANVISCLAAFAGVRWLMGAYA